MMILECIKTLSELDSNSTSLCAIPRTPEMSLTHDRTQNTETIIQVKYMVRIVRHKK